MKILSFLTGAAMLLSAQVALGQPTVGATYDKWVFDCQALAEGKTSCGLVQTVRSEDGNSVLGRVTLSHDSEKAENRIIISLPLGVALAQPVAGKIDDGEPMSFPAYTCWTSGCTFGRKLEAAEIDALKTGSELVVAFAFVRGGGKVVGFKASLSGLTDAFAEAGW
jgi:invasion protein IalB